MERIHPPRRDSLRRAKPGADTAFPGVTAGGVTWRRNGMAGAARTGGGERRGHFEIFQDDTNPKTALVHFTDSRADAVIDPSACKSFRTR
jgi:hypothetical protein